MGRMDKCYSEIADMLAPDVNELEARAHADFHMGVPVLIGNRLVLAIETLSQARLSFLQSFDPPPELVITRRRASTLKARVYDGAIARVIIPPRAGLEWIKAVADPVGDLETPLKGPLQTIRTCEAKDSQLAITLIKKAQLLPAAITCEISNPQAFARAHNLTCLDPQMLEQHLQRSGLMHPVINARVPLEVSQASKLHVFRPDDSGTEHYAVEIGTPPRESPVLMRLHSACFTGDVLGSLKCDCGPQLRGALSMMGDEGQGILLYLNQEGRGIGLANKMRAYSLQDQGFDTVEANHRIGFEDDERDFRIGAGILKELGFAKIRLLTNNPAKVKMLEDTGLEVVERVPLNVGKTRHNAKYLATKARKSGHLL